MLWMRPGAGRLGLSRPRAGGGGRAGRSLGLGGREMGRRMSDGIRIGGRVGEMSLFCLVRSLLLAEGGGVWCLGV